MWCKKKRKRKLFSDVCSACREYSFSTLSANKSRVSRVVNPSCHRHIIHIADTRTSCYDRHQKTVNAKRGPPRKFHAVFPLIREAPQLFLLPTRHQKPFPRCIQLSLSPFSISPYSAGCVSLHIIITVLLQHTPKTLEQTGLTIHCIIHFIFSIRNISFKAHDCFMDTV